ncbi:MAG: hypothetical protein MSA90_16435 [Faecalicatena sp.]|uniref:RNase H family protein n=1 Tax=Faecalicatena sp. TaxID=2005360 RepID=UPI002587A902|nr:RNase H family protein [Faecalicatena sp.]MCI6467040.1 hypothetical protein [Faecalicatena sp.]MDY5617457.1 RNase H family protein [Lachnospiraceae bacterium]
MKKFEIKIYVKTSLCGTGIRNGSYAAIVECQTSKGPVTREITGKEESTTYYRSVLLGIVKALEILNTPCSVTIYTDCTYIKNIAERGSPESWRRSEWKKPSGEEVKNRELWQQFLEQMDKHIIAFHFSRHNDYVKRLKELLKEKER